MSQREEYRTEIYPQYVAYTYDYVGGTQDVFKKKVNEIGRSVSDCSCEWKSSTFNVKGEPRKVLAFLIKAGLLNLSLKEDKMQVITYPWINICDFENIKIFIADEFK